jgi:hypothetical protein
LREGSQPLRLAASAYNCNQTVLLLQIPAILRTVWRATLNLTIAVAASCLPNDWRKAFALDESLWRVGTSISGLCEALAALLLLIAWYSYSVTHWAQRAIFSTIAAHPQASIPPGTEGLAALTLLLFHPLTWLIVFLAFEGTIRFLAAAFTGTVLGSLPFYALARLLRFVHRPAAPLPDELLRRTNGADEILEIRSANAKTGWEPPRIIRFNGSYFSLYNRYRRQSSERPFVYELRKLSAGVPGPTVLEYGQSES